MRLRRAAIRTRFRRSPFGGARIRRRSKVRATVLDYFQPGTRLAFRNSLTCLVKTRPYLLHLARTGSYRSNRDRYGTRRRMSLDHMQNASVSQTRCCTLSGVGLSSWSTRKREMFNATNICYFVVESVKLDNLDQPRL